MIHLQKTVPNWLEAVARLPAGSCILAVDQVQESDNLVARSKAKGFTGIGKAELKRVAAIQKRARDELLAALPGVMASNPNVEFALRHHYDFGQQSDGTFEQQKQRSREFFATFIDDTFSQYAVHVDYVLGFNEYFANSQTEAERAAWVSQARAMAHVWVNEYRTIPAFSHIRLVIANVAVGNDVPIGIASVYWDYRPAVVVGYHPYTHWSNGVRSDGDWQFLSGRWAQNEADWGIPVEWLFTEAGPFESAITGWRSDACLGHSVSLYLESIRQWIRDCATTPAYREGRLHGFCLFTTGRAGTTWRGYWTEQPELNALADMVAQEWQPGTSPPPPPPPPPDPKGEPRVQYGRTVLVIPPSYTIEEAHAVLDEAWSNRNSVGWSYDDAGIGDLERRTAILYGIPAGEEQQAMTAWFDIHYTGTVIEFTDVAPDDDAPPEIIDIVDELPQDPDHDYATRPLSAITALTIHHTTGAPFQPIENIASFHVNTRGWPGIGYHYVIDGAGTIHQTNYLTTKSFHAGTLNAPGDENLWSVGVALQGNFQDAPPPQVQQDAARALVQYLKQTLDLSDVFGHREMPGAQTACPGSTFEEWLPYVRGD